MASTSPFDSFIKEPQGEELAALLREAREEIATTPLPAVDSRQRPSGRHWSKADNEAHYAAVLVVMLDEDVDFPTACTRVAHDVGRQKSAFRTTMEGIARREKAARLLGIR